MEIAELYQRFLASQGVFTDTRKPLAMGLFFVLQGPILMLILLQKPR